MRPAPKKGARRLEKILLPPAPPGRFGRLILSPAGQLAGKTGERQANSVRIPACHATLQHEIGPVDTPLPKRSPVRQENQRLRLTAAPGSAYPPTKGRAGGKLPSGNRTVRSPRRVPGDLRKSSSLRRLQ